MFGFMWGLLDLIFSLFIPQETEAEAQARRWREICDRRGGWVE